MRANSNTNKNFPANSSSYSKTFFPFTNTKATEIYM